MYYKPFYKKFVFWAVTLLIIAAGLAAFFIVRGNIRRAEEEAAAVREESDSEWKSFIDEAGYADLIRDTLENATQYNMSLAKWEYSFLDLDGDGRDELAVRVSGGGSDTRSHTFIFAHKGDDAVLAGYFEDNKSPLYSASLHIIEVESSEKDGVTSHRFCTVREGELVDDAVLEERAGKYYRGGDEISMEEFSSYYADCRFPEWTKFQARFVYTARDPYIDMLRAREPLEDVGEVPKEFESIIDGNLFCEATVRGDKLTKTLYEFDEFHHARLLVYDKYGKLQASATVDGDKGIFDFCPTSDGGLLAALNYDPDYYIDKAANFEPIRVVKYDSQGKEEWIYGDDLTIAETYNVHVDEYDGNYFVFFVGKETATDDGARGLQCIYGLKLDENGNELVLKQIGAERYSLIDAGVTDGRVEVVRFKPYSNDAQYTKLTLDLDFNFLDEETVEQDDILRSMLFGSYIDGVIEDPDNYDGGNTMSMIDYGDFCLVVSQYYRLGATDPLSSKISAVYDTVYTAFDYDGNMLWRRSVPTNYDMNWLWLISDRLFSDRIVIEE